MLVFFSPSVFHLVIDSFFYFLHYPLFVVIHHILSCLFFMRVKDIFRYFLTSMFVKDAADDWRMLWKCLVLPDVCVWLTSVRNRVADVFMISVSTAFLLFSWCKTAVCNSVANHVSFLFLSKGICSSNALKMYMSSWLAFWFWGELFPIHLCHCTTESCSNHTDSLVFSVTRQTDLSNSHQETDTDLRCRHNECFFTSRL